MNQTKQTQMSQKAIMHVIQRQLLTLVMEIKGMLQALATEICNKYY